MKLKALPHQQTGIRLQPNALFLGFALRLSAETCRNFAPAFSCSQIRFWNSDGKQPQVCSRVILQPNALSGVRSVCERQAAFFLGHWPAAMSAIRMPTGLPGNKSQPRKAKHGAICRKMLGQCCDSFSRKPIALQENVFLDIILSSLFSLDDGIGGCSQMLEQNRDWSLNTCRMLGKDPTQP